MTDKKNFRRFITMMVCLVLTFTTLFATASTADAATYSGRYWLKVNEQRNVITAYEKQGKKWVPVRAMLCSTGIGGTTPRGTFYTQGKWNWGPLMNDVYGQYCTHITGDVLFHSVYYLEAYDKASQPTSQFNALGSAASHGCVRLSVMDAKWIYDNCKTGTKVTIYRSSTSGPLGKPSGITVSTGRYQYWDPTDPDPRNPYYKLKKPVITVSSKKKTQVQYGSTYKLKSYVTAKDPNSFMKLTDKLKVSKVQRYSTEKKKYVSAKFSTKKLGTYKVTYYVNDPYSGKTSKTIKIKVVDNLKAPKIYGAKNRTVTWGDTDAVGSVTAKQASAVRTKKMTVHIKAPGASSYKKYSYAKAKEYKFSKTGTYKVKYTVKNKYKPYKEASKTITITSKKGAVNADPALTLPDRIAFAAEDEQYLDLYAGSSLDLLTDVTAVHNGKDVTDSITIKIKTPESEEYQSWTGDADNPSYTFTQPGTYYIKYSVKNLYAPYQTVSKTVKVRV